MEVQILVAGVRDPVEMAQYPVGKAISPGAHQHGSDDHQRNVGEDGETERDRHVIADAQFSANLRLAQRPGNKGADRANRDDLPQAAFLQRRERQSVFEVGRGDVDLPDIPCRPERSAVKDHGDADGGEDERRDAEEADEEGTDPEVKQVAAQEGAAPHAVFLLEIEHRHGGRSPDICFYSVL